MLLEASLPKALFSGKLYGSNLTQGFRRVEHELKQHLQTIAGDVQTALDDRNMQGKLRRGEHSLEDVLQSDV